MGKSKSGKKQKDVEAQDSSSSDVSVDKDNTKHKQTKSVTHRKIAGGHVTTTVITNESEREAQQSSRQRKGGGLLACFRRGGPRGKGGRWALYQHPIGIIFAVVAAVTILLGLIAPCFLLGTLLSLDPRRQSREDLHRMCQNTPGHMHFICDENQRGCYSRNYRGELVEYNKLCIGKYDGLNTKTRCLMACGVYHTKFETMFSLGYAVCVIHILGGLAALVLILLPCTSILGLIIGSLVYSFAAVGTVAIIVIGDHGYIVQGFKLAVDLIFDPAQRHNTDTVQGTKGHFYQIDGGLGIDSSKEFLRKYQKLLGTLYPAIYVELAITVISVVILVALLVFFCMVINNRII